MTPLKNALLENEFTYEIECYGMTSLNDFTQDFISNGGWSIGGAVIHSWPITTPEFAHKRAKQATKKPNEHYEEEPNNLKQSIAQCKHVLNNANKARTAQGRI